MYELVKRQNQIRTTIRNISTSHLQDLKCEHGCQRIGNFSTQSVVVQSPMDSDLRSISTHMKHINKKNLKFFYACIQLSANYDLLTLFHFLPEKNIECTFLVARILMLTVKEPLSICLQNIIDILFSWASYSAINLTAWLQKS